MLVMLLLSLAAGAASTARAEDTPSVMHDEARDHLYEGRIDEAAELLQRLVDEHPEYYASYSDYWIALGRISDAETMREHVRASLERFERVPSEQRPEDLYHAAMEAARYLDAKEREEAFRAEAVERYPRGLTAQSARLAAARRAEPPRVASALYAAYIEEFPENKSWVQLAARDRFEVVASHPDAFTVDEMAEAAEAFDRTSVAYIPVYGNPTVRLHALVVISSAFLDRDPKRALTYADRGRGFVAETAPQTDEFDESIDRNFDAVRVMACARLERWEEARELASAMLVERGDRALELIRWLPFDEPVFRATYAEILAATGDVQEAHRQGRYAVALDSSLQLRYDALRAAHPIDRKRAEAMAIAVDTFLASRQEERKRRLLARELDRPAPPFALPDLEGDLVSIAQFRGKVVVLDLWATWCGPCIKELEELERTRAEYAGVPDIAFVAVSLDSDKSAVRPFMERTGYGFVVLLSDGSVEKDYARDQGIPQLYLIDRDGIIRFHQVGFAPEHFREHLDWMIEAVMNR